MKRAEKTFFVENLASELAGAKSIVLVNFAGLNVASQQELKRRLKKVKAKMLVVKNTLFALAGAKAKIDKKALSDTVLTGQTALVMTEADPIAPLSVLVKFAKEFDTGGDYSVPDLKVGIIEGSFQNKESLIKLSNLPGRDALLRQLLANLMSNLYTLINTLQNPMQQLVYTLNTKTNSH